MSNFVSDDNMTALMTAIGNKKDNKPIEVTWDQYIAMSDAQKTGKHFIISGGPGGGGFEQKQADWNQIDTTAVDYIKNKPTVTSTVASGSTDLITSGGVYAYIDTMITQALTGSY